MMFVRKILAGTVIATGVTLGCLPAAPAQATLLAYDGFAAGGEAPVPTGTYISAPASTDGVNRDSIIDQHPDVLGFDTADAWSLTGGTSAVTSSVYPKMESSGLSHPDMPSVAGALNIQRSNNSSAYEKRDLRSTDITGSLSTFYVSILVNFNAHRTALVQLGSDASHYNYFGFTDSGQATAGRAALNMTNVGSETRTRIAYTADTTFDANVIHLLVLRYNSDGSFAYWVDPTDLSNESANTPTLTDTGMYATGSIPFIGLDAVAGPYSSTYFDELRIATTWSEATAVPEPAALGLIAPTIAWLCASRRSRSL